MRSRKRSQTVAVCSRFVVPKRSRAVAFPLGEATLATNGYAATVRMLADVLRLDS